MHIASIYLYSLFSYNKSMNYVVGSRIDLTHLNTPQQQAKQVEEVSRPKTPGKYLTGTKINFLTMSAGLVVMNVVEPTMFLSVHTG